MMRGLALRGLLFALLWWILAVGRFDTWWLGAIGVVAATWASLRLAPPRGHRLRARALLAFAGFFLWNSVRGGAQVAWYALRPRIGIAPILHDFRTVLPAGAPRLLLLNALGLMPGTVGVRLDDDTLRLHVLDANLPTPHEVRALEAHIARVFGVGS